MPDPEKTGEPTRGHGFGAEFPWEFDMEAPPTVPPPTLLAVNHHHRHPGNNNNSAGKGVRYRRRGDPHRRRRGASRYAARVTFTEYRPDRRWRPLLRINPNPPDSPGPPVRIGPKDMVNFPKGWKGRWQVHLLRKFCSSQLKRKKC